MLDDNHGIARIDQLLQHVYQTVHVRNVQAGGRLVQDIDGLAGRALGQLGRKLGALRLAAGERRGRLSELDIAEADLSHGLKPSRNFGHVGEELARLVHRHVEHLVDVLTLVAHLKRLLVIALALTHVAGHIHIRQEVHLDLQKAVARAGLAAAALDVEGKPARPVAARLGVRRFGEQVANVIEHAGIGCRVGARRAPDGRLVNIDHLVQIGQPGDLIMRARARLGAVELGGQLFVQDLVDERGFARAGHAGHAGERAQRDGEVRVLEIVDRAALDDQLFAVALAAHGRHGDTLAAGQVLAGDRVLALHQLVHLAGEHDLAAVPARARADVHDEIRRAHGVLVMLDHDQRVAQIAQALEGREQLVVVALVQADGGLVQNIQHAHERRADLGRQTDALALAAGQRARRARQGQVFQADRLQEAQPVLDLLDHAVADFMLHLGQAQGLQEFHRLDDRLLRKLRNVQPADRDRKHLRPQATAVARRARDLAHALLNL